MPSKYKVQPFPSLDINMLGNCVANANLKNLGNNLSFLALLAPYFFPMQQHMIRTDDATNIQDHAQLLFL